MRGSVVIAGIVILLLGGGLAVADYVIKERPIMIALQEPMVPAESSSSSSSSVSSSVASVPSLASSSSSSSLPSASSSPGVVKKGVSTKKAVGINVTDVLAKLQLISQPTGEASFLSLTAADKTKVQTSVLLRNNDRAFLFSWTESDDVKKHFASLKQALQEQFSGKVSDLVDEVRTSDNGPPVDYLSFLDPALSAERIVFLRVRTRLYELHIAENGTELLEALVAELSK